MNGSRGGNGGSRPVSAKGGRGRKKPRKGKKKEGKECAFVLDRRRKEGGDPKVEFPSMFVPVLFVLKKEKEEEP